MSFTNFAVARSVECVTQRAPIGAAMSATSRHSVGTSIFRFPCDATLALSDVGLATADQLQGRGRPAFGGRTAGHRPRGLVSGIRMLDRTFHRAYVSYVGHLPL